MAAGAGVAALGSVDPRMTGWRRDTAMRLLKMLLVLFVCAAGPAVVGPYEDGVAAHRKGDYATTLRLLRPFADRGNATAQYALGLMYYNGQGVSQDYAAAVSWYRKAADQGDDSAQFNLGAMYDNGRGVAQDYAAAVSWTAKPLTRAMPTPSTTSASSTTTARGACRRTTRQRFPGIERPPTRAMPAPRTTLASCTPTAGACRSTTPPPLLERPML